MRPWAYCFVNSSAIRLRAPLCVQAKSTRIYPIPLSLHITPGVSIPKSIISLKMKSTCRSFLPWTPKTPQPLFTPNLILKKFPGVEYPGKGDTLKAEFSRTPGKGRKFVAKRKTMLRLRFPKETERFSRIECDRFDRPKRGAL